MKLAKLHLEQASRDAYHDNAKRAITNMIAAIGLVITSVNNVASIAHKVKPKKRRRTAPVHRKYLGPLDADLIKSLGTVGL